MQRESSERFARPDLDHDAAGAGMALACAFSSADEFYADIIRERRASGVYGVAWYRGSAAIVCAAIVLFAGILLAI